LLVRPRSQTDQRKLHYPLKNPEHSQTHGKTKKKIPLKLWPTWPRGAKLRK
jgi:hypothetical protein